MPRAVARLAEQRVDTVVVNGGDGTTVTLVTELCNGSPFPHMPGLIVLAGGNTNLIAADVGIPGPPVRALNRVLSAIGSGTPLSRARRHLIRLDQDGEPPRFGFFFGAVGIVRATALARSMVHPLGLKHGLANAAALGLGALRILFGHERGAGGLFAPIAFELAYDRGTMSRHEYAVLMATTLDRLLFGARPNPGRSMSPRSAPPSTGHFAR